MRRAKSVRTQAGLCGAGAALLLLGAPGQAQAGEIYYVDWGSTQGVFSDDTIRTINKDGSGAQTLLTLERPIGLALDAANNRLFYASGGAGAIGRVGVINLSNNADTPLVSGAALGGDNDAQHIKLDLSAGKMYWASYSQGLRRANLDGSSVELVQAGGAYPNSRGHLAIGNGSLYFGSPGTQDVFQGTLTAPTVAADIGWNTSGANDLALNPAGTRFYWPSLSGVQSNNLAGTDLQTLVTGLTTSLGVAVSSDGSTVFWAERHGADGDGRIGWDDTDPNTPANPTFINTGMGFGIAVAPIPEPGTVTLLAMAGGALFMRRRRTEA